MVWVGWCLCIGVCDGIEYVEVVCFVDLVLSVEVVFGYVEVIVVVDVYDGVGVCVVVWWVDESGGK